MRIEPGLGARDMRADALDDPPEARRMIHLDQMGDLMRREIVEHEGWREDQPPRIGQDAGRRAGAPTARRVADRHPFDVNAERFGGEPAGGLQVGFGLALEKIEPGARMRRSAGNAKQAFAAGVLDPDRAALTVSMLDAWSSRAAEAECRRRRAPVRAAARAAPRSSRRVFGRIRAPASVCRAAAW